VTWSPWGSFILNTRIVIAIAKMPSTKVCSREIERENGFFTVSIGHRSIAQLIIMIIKTCPRLTMSQTKNIPSYRNMRMERRKMTCDKTANRKDPPEVQRLLYPIV